MPALLLARASPPCKPGLAGMLLARQVDGGDLPPAQGREPSSLAIGFHLDVGITLRDPPVEHIGKPNASPLAELLGRMCRRDESALTALHVACADRLFRVALRIVGRREMALEAVSSAFLQAWQHAADFDDQRAPVVAWLSMMVRCRALDLLRQATARGEHECELADPEFEAIAGALPEPSNGVEQSEQRVGLRRAMATLTSVQRQVLSLIYLEGRSQEDAAAQIGLPLGTVKSHSRRALAALRAHKALRAAHA